jgi:hypothetical protein
MARYVAWLGAIIFVLQTGVIFASENASEPKTSMTTRGKLLFSDDFTEPLDSRWRANVGQWEVKDGVLTGAEREKDMHGAVARHAMPMQDVVIQFDFKLDGCKGISLSINDAKEHVCRLQITTTGVSLRKDDHDHTGPDMAVIFESLPEKFKQGTWYTAVVEMRGPEMVAQVGDLRPMFGEHELIGTAKANFGFTVAGQSASFRNVRVWEAKPNSDWPATKKHLEQQRDKKKKVSK